MFKVLLLIAIIHHANSFVGKKYVKPSLTVQADTNSQCPRNTGESWETSYANPLVINFLDTTSREYSIMWNCQGLACSEQCGTGDCGNCESIVSTAGSVFSVVLDSNKTQTSLRLQSDPVLCDIANTDLNNQTTFVLGQNNTCRVDSNLADCLQYTDCSTCATVSTCGWCNGLCISINSSASGKTPTISCPNFISEKNKCCPTYTDCETCSSSPIGCGFCYDEPQGSCYKLNSTLPPSNVQCITWQLNSSQCTFQTANQTVPIRQGAEKKSTVSVTSNNTLSIWTGTQFQSTFFSTVELPRMYGGLPLANLSKYTIMEWYQYAVDLNVDALYFYDLLPPLFYKLLEIFNSGKTKPLRFFQVIQPDPHYDFNAVLADNTKIINDVVGSIHGNFSDYSTDVSPLLAGWILGESWSQDWLKSIDAFFAERIFDAKYFVYKKKSGISYVLIDVWLSGIVTADGNFGWEHPVALGNNYVTDPMTHPYNPVGSENITLDATIATGRSGKVSYFATMSANPYDSVGIRYEYLNCPLCDNSQLDPYSGYLRQLKSIYSGLPVLLTGIGFGTSEYATAHAPLGRDDGGHTEVEQGEILSEVITRVWEEKYAGISMKSLIDDWSQQSWNTKLLEQNSQKWKNHYNPRQNFGLIGLKPLLANSSSTLTVDGASTEWTNRTATDLGGGSGRAWHDAEYLYVLISASPAKLWSNDDTLWMGVSVTGEGTRRIEPVAGDFILSLDMYLQIRGNYSDSSSGIFVRNGYNPLIFYYPNQIPNSNYTFDTQYMNTTKWRIPSEFSYQAGCDFFQADIIPAGVLDPQIDYARSQQHIEVKIPWTLLGFVDPSSRLVWDYLPSQANSSLNYTLPTKTASSIQLEFVRYNSGDQSTSQWTGILTYSIGQWTTPPVSVKKKAGFATVASTIASLEGETPPSCTRPTSVCWIEQSPAFCGATTEGTTSGRPDGISITDASICPQSCQVALGITIPFLCIIAGVVAFIWFKTKKKNTKVQNLVNKMEEKANDISVPVNLRVREGKKKSLASRLRDEVMGNSRPNSASRSRSGSRGSWTPSSSGSRSGGWTPSSQISFTPTDQSGTNTPGGRPRSASGSKTPNRTRSGSLPANFAHRGSHLSTRRNTPGMTPAIGTSPLITPGLTPLMTPGSTPGLTPIQTPGITPIHTPGMTPSHTPGITPTMTPVRGMTPMHTPGITPIHTPGITPIHTPGITPFQTPGATPVQTPGATPSHTPLMSRRNSLDGTTGVLARPKILEPLRAPPSLKSLSDNVPSDNNNTPPARPPSPPARAPSPVPFDPNQVVPFVPEPESLPEPDVVPFESEPEPQPDPQSPAQTLSQPQAPSEPQPPLSQPQVPSEPPVIPLDPIEPQPEQPAVVPLDPLVAQTESSQTPGVAEVASPPPQPTPTLPLKSLPLTSTPEPEPLSPTSFIEMESLVSSLLENSEEEE